MKWGQGQDIETPQEQLSYNLRFGTSKNENNEVIGDMVAGLLGQTQSESSQMIGNMHYSTYVVLNIPRQAYYWQVQTIDLQRGVGVWSQPDLINEETHGGWDNEDILLSTCCFQYDYEAVCSTPNLKGKVSIEFRLRDFERNNCQLTDFQFSYMYRHPTTRYILNRSAAL